MKYICECKNQSEIVFKIFLLGLTMFQMFINFYKHFHEEHIVTDTIDIPRINYKLNDKNHYYFPDLMNKK